MVQMPALNTPQFSWVKSRLPRKPQPVPPIFQPEVAADAIFQAAHDYRREWYVGWPTVKAIVGNKLVPALGDWYLARTGYDSQQGNETADPDRPHNLWESGAGKHQAHGDFDDQASDISRQLWITKNRNWLMLAGAGAACVALAAGLTSQSLATGARS